MGAQGTATLDFGAFPGKQHTTVAVTGQAGIVSGSLVEAWLRMEATADHSSDEHMLEEIYVMAGDIVAATGFTIHGVFKPTIAEPVLQRSTMREVDGTIHSQPNIYGLWTVGWVWN